MKVLTYVTKYGHIFNRPFAKVSEQQENVDFDAMARKMYEVLKPEASFEEFSQGMKEEMEHEDITGGDLGLTGKIVMAHLKEDANYYSKLSAAMKKGGPGSGRYPEGSGGKEPTEDMDRRFKAIADKHIADKPSEITSDTKIEYDKDGMEIPGQFTDSKAPKIEGLSSSDSKYVNELADHVEQIVLENNESYKNEPGQFMSDWAAMGLGKIDPDDLVNMTSHASSFFTKNPKATNEELRSFVIDKFKEWQSR